ncbi:MAG: hypothetical protein EBY39_10245 [Flavobacteriia bacterium]|nr:hypothetical protein [Flavobacteriia bacterium]
MSGELTGFLGGIGQVFSNQAQKNEAKKQRQFSLDMWRRQNAYNTPAKQMQRLKEAGLNPALMYGQGNVGNAQQAMGVQQAQIKNVGAAAAQSVASGTQLDLANYQKRLLSEQADATRLNAAANMMKAVSDKTRTGFLGQKLSYEINEMVSKTLQQKTQAGLNVSATELNQARKQVQLKTIGLYDKQMNLMTSQINLNKAQRQMVFTKINEIGQRVAMDWINTQSTARNATSQERQAMAAEVRNELILEMKKMDIKLGKRGQNISIINNVVGGLFGLAGNLVL